MVTVEEPDKKLKVYYQPPNNTGMDYPCIVFKLDDQDTKFANNRPYLHFDKYQVTIIDSDPLSAIPAKVADLPTCTFDRRFISDNLHHTVYNLYF